MNPALTPVYPTIHLNGDTKDTLLDEHCEAMSAIREAIEKLPHPNGRNYYPQGPDAIGKAQAQHRDWAEQLCSVLREIEKIAEYIADQPGR